MEIRFPRSSRPDQEEEQLDKLSSNTLKRHPRMDLNKTDMLQLLSYLEGELQARDIVIAALRMEKTKHLLYHAKCGHFGQEDALYALQRDSDLQKDNSFGELAVKSMYDDQLFQLENLITTQHSAQHKMREQLASLEKRYHKMCAELDDEKLKHSRDLEQSDNITYLLEKDRERLKQELDFEKSHKKKMEKELKKLNVSLDEQKKATPIEHKQVAIMLIKEQTKLMQKLTEMQQLGVTLDSAVADKQQRVLELQDTLAKASHKSMQVEATMEKRFSELDFESEQLKSRIAKAEQHGRELLVERDRLQGLLSGEHVPPRLTADLDPGVPSMPTSARHPHGYVAERTVTPAPVVNTVRVVRGLSPNQPARQQVRNKSPGTTPDSKGHARVLLDTGGTEIADGHSFGVATTTSVPFRQAPVGRGVPPPVPPNKPQMFMSMQPALARPVGELPAPANEMVAGASLLAGHQQLSHGIAIAKEAPSSMSKSTSGH